MKFKRKVLPNGMRVITVCMADNPTVTVLVMVEAGSGYETKPINGVSHFLEHMCFKGTTKRPKAIDISRELDGIGSQYNAFTSEEFTGYYAKSNFRHLDTVLDIVSDLYLNQTFPASEIEKEKGVIIDEISMYEDLPHSEVHNVFSELLYGDQPAGWKVTGTKESVRALTREDLLDYRTRHYVADATTVIVAGNFDDENIQADIERRFAGISTVANQAKQKVVESQTEPQISLRSRKTDQAHLVIGVRAYDTYDDKIMTLRVLSNVLGGGMSSRLFQKLRDEMGLGYYVNSSCDAYVDHGHFAVSTGVDHSRVAEVLAAVMNEFKRLKTEPVGAAELDKVKEYMIGNMYLGLESSDSLADFYGSQEIMRKKILLPEDFVSEIRAVTSEGILGVAQEIFRDDRLNFAAVGPFEDKDRQDFLQNLKF